MATEVLKPVSGNASQAVANDDFEAYQREANKADLEQKFGKPKEVETKVVEIEKKAEPEKKAAEEKNKPLEQLTRRELRERMLRLETENKQLRETKREPEKKEVKAEVVEDEPEKKPEPLRARPKSDDVVDGKPKYKDWSEYEDDLLAWNREKIFRDLDERNAKLTQEQQIEATNKTIEQSWRERVVKSREAHADFDEVALSPEGPGKLIQPGSWVDEWLMDSENGAELLYYFGQHPEELLKFQDVDKNFGGTPTTRRAVARRALVRLEDKLVAAVEKKTEETEKSEETARAERDEVRTTKTPKPASDVGGRGTSLPDPVAAAIAGGTDADTARYIQEMNRREIKERFGDRR